MAIHSSGLVAGYFSGSGVTPVVWEKVGAPPIGFTYLSKPSGWSDPFNGYATDIAIDGVVVGYGNGNGCSVNGIRWTRNGSVWTVGTPLNNVSVSQSYVYGTSADGRLVGALQTTSGTAFKAFRTIPGVSQMFGFDSLGTLSGIATDTSSTRHVNRLRDCVGESKIVGGSTRGFLCLSTQTQLQGQATAIGTFQGNSSYALGINDSREVVGKAQNAAGAYRAFLYTPSGVLRDLSTLSGSTAWVLNDATAINTSGVIVGNGTLSGSGCAYLLIPTP